MSRFLSRLDDGVYRALRLCVGIAVTVIVFAVFAGVLARQFRVSIGGGEELPVYAMIVCGWLAAALGARGDSHIKLDLYRLVVKSEKGQAIVDLFVSVLTVFAVAYLGVLSIKYVAFSFKSGEILPGLGVPRWWFALVMPISSFVMAGYYLATIWRLAREVFG